MLHSIYYITGVSGSGKSTIGASLASKIGISFYDGDDFHPKSNVLKMSKGIPLTDDDRFPWLQSINKFVVGKLLSESLVVACSALKQTYREELIKDINLTQIKWIHLQGSFDIVYNRMSQREGHFMPKSLLQSQFDSYEEPASGIILDIVLSKEEIITKVMEQNVQKSEIGIIGLGVMGTSLARNMARNDISLSLFNRHVEGKEELVAVKATKKYPELIKAVPFDQLSEFVDSLSIPRKVLLMVNAGSAVDQIINNLKELLTPGDIIIEGGNSHYKDTESRIKILSSEGIHYIGTGVSGGEEGALIGPSIMPSGSLESYRLIAPIFDKIAAKNSYGDICCSYIGQGGSGHFVKMVHNGIEYAEMQLIAEVYNHLRYDQNQSLNQIAALFTEWNDGDESSYLLGITIDILHKKDIDGKPLLDKVLDQAGNKGTGSWTTIAACELGVPIPTITAALYARYQSSYKSDRVKYHKDFHLDNSIINLPNEYLRILYRLCRILNHHQGFELIKEASHFYNWRINLENLAQTWSGGCIIKSKLLDEIRIGFQTKDNILSINTIKNFFNHSLKNSLLAQSTIAKSRHSYSCINASLDYLKYMTSASCNANLIQAQRDCFGAHTYKRTDDGGIINHHSNWIED